MTRSKNAYFEKLKDPRWQRKRLVILEAARFACTECFLDNKTLHVHHLYYVWGRDPWEYPNDALTCLCEDCHQKRKPGVKVTLEAYDLARLRATVRADEELRFDSRYLQLCLLILELGKEALDQESRSASGKPAPLRSSWMEAIDQRDAIREILIWTHFHTELRNICNPSPDA